MFYPYRGGITYFKCIEINKVSLSKLRDEYHLSWPMCLLGRVSRFLVIKIWSPYFIRYNMGCFDTREYLVFLGYTAHAGPLCQCYQKDVAETTFNNCVSFIPEGKNNNKCLMLSRCFK